MAVSQAQKLAKEKYRQEKRDQMTLEVPKGKREVYKAIAARLGLSLSMLVQHSVESYGADHAGEEFKPTTQDKQPRLSEDEKALLEAFSHMPDDARKGFLKGFRILSRLSEEALAAKKQYFDLFRETTERQNQPKN